jgi:NAD(P)-dependent dehydrogenase (short-subunit alcohol dehydrogenase family)
VQPVTRGVLGAPVTHDELDGRVAVITGASRGIGAGLASHFIGFGLRVGICARKRPEPPFSSDRNHVVSRSVDVRDAADLEGFGAVVVERFGKIDLWINNAGVAEPIGKLADVDPGMFAHQILVNVVGVANGARTFARHLRRRSGGGVLLNLSSGAATTNYPGWAGYCASKAAVDRLTAVVAEEETDHGLRAYAVSPGRVDTAMHTHIRASSPESFPAVPQFLDAKREGRFNTVPWVADAFLELAFGETGFASGSILRVPDEWDAGDQ